MTILPPLRLRGLAALAAAGGALAVAAAEPRFDSGVTRPERAQDPVAWVLAQAGGLPASPAAEPEQAAPRAGSWTSRLMPFLDSSEPVGFAPARWGGSVSLEQLQQRASDQFTRRVSTAMVSLAAASYFWQPWFAQVRGNLVVLGALEKGAEGAPLDDARGDTRTLSLSGGGTLTVFPSSRFPFLASLESSDSRASGEFAPSDYRNTRTSLRQTYRSPLGESLYSASLDHSVLTSESFGRDAVLALNGSYLRTTEPHRIDAAIAWSRNRRSMGGEGSDLLRLSGRHSYRAESGLWVESLASFSGTDFDVSGTEGSLTFSSRVSQIMSQAVWRPESEERLVLSGGGRLLDTSVGAAEGRVGTRTVSGNLGATFAMTEEATVTATANVNELSQSGGPSVVTAIETLGANYVSRPFDLRLASWSYSAGAQASHQSGGEEAGRTIAGVQADHQVSRAIPVGTSATFNLLATQGGAVIDDTVRGRTLTVRHTGSAGLRAITSDASDAFLGVSAGQSESTGGIEDRFRLVNVQASGQLRFSAFDFLSMNLTAQWTRSRRDGEAGEESRRQLFGTVSYQHARVLGVPRLRFIASASFSDAFLDSRLLGNLDASRENVTRLIDQRLLYDIGRLEIRLGMRIARIEGRDDRQWYIRINRQFGQY